MPEKRPNPAHLHLEIWKEPHLGLEREPSIEPERRRRSGRPPKPPERDRSCHAGAIGIKFDATVSAITDTRQRLGIDPNRLLVVEFGSWDPACREVMEERFDAFVVDERLVATSENTEITKILVQFPSLNTITLFKEQVARYGLEAAADSVLPRGVRHNFFDCLETVRTVSREERLGNRLRQEAFPDQGTFALDIDLWSPGTDDGNRSSLQELRALCQEHGGTVSEYLETSNLILARVTANRGLADVLLDLDVVAQVNLPPVLPAFSTESLQDVEPLPAHTQPNGHEPIVTVVDSGVLPGHALLRGWIVEEHDFDTGEGTVVDQQGHGTQVAGLAMYGSIERCLRNGVWRPDTMVASAKVLVKDPNFPDRAMFPENHRPEALVARAIRHFHETRNCRVFNLSVGNPGDVYSGGRQWPWAEVLDQLARELDIVIVVASGNYEQPQIPSVVSSRDHLQQEIRDLRLATGSARLTSPATSSISVTVGAIARSAHTRIPNSVAGAPAGAPAPFSRVGPGYENKSKQRAVKPEFVAYGGNYAIRNLVRSEPIWGFDPHLGEPTTRLNSDGGRPLTTATGTSFAAPQVANAAAWALEAASRVSGTASANAARALLGVCAETPPCGDIWLLDPDGKDSDDKLRLSGFGLINAERVRTSLSNDTCLIASDEVEEDHWHVYELPVPPAFVGGGGKRGITVALAFDPPVRSSRRQYLARTMWLEVMKGLSSDEIIRYRRRYVAPEKAPPMRQSKLLALRPPKGDLQWSTLQVRRKTWTRAPKLPILAGGTEPVIHVLVGCQKRFPHGEAPGQRYSVAVRFWHSDIRVNLYQQIRTRVRTRATVPARLERRG